ncbi:MAG: hypothetical protein J5867_00470 [Prevotella sp.]|nr:hypothetical protein [Prevotella sp.]
MAGHDVVWVESLPLGRRHGMLRVQRCGFMGTEAWFRGRRCGVCREQIWYSSGADASFVALRL